MSSKTDDPPRRASSAEMDSEHQTELADRVAAINMSAGDGLSNGKKGLQANGMNNGDGSTGNSAKKAARRPVLSSRKLSLQERSSGNNAAVGSGFGPYATGPYSHVSPRVARRPTIESKHISISDSQVSARQLWVVQEGRRRRRRRRRGRL
ncbi:Calcium/calmodulin-dependent protein kinase kinase 1 [Acipenser ruthenus]|uniref:Calcium/calmodulin-dependent protein kinase kinase 1 n=1 Tax=Acipenser ruthenus TaxID=7906 RepID=A0A444UU43_ACIRT|nr:Calcium/calmodulin-dependent protein kinase kinase 1 [Acipenser ruthenus]